MPLMRHPQIPGTTHYFRDGQVPALESAGWQLVTLPPIQVDKESLRTLAAAIDKHESAPPSDPDGSPENEGQS